MPNSLLAKLKNKPSPVKFQGIAVKPASKQDKLFLRFLAKLSYHILKFFYKVEKL